MNNIKFVAACCKFESPRTDEEIFFMGVNHYDDIMQSQIIPLFGSPVLNSWPEMTKGYIGENGVFYTEFEAIKISRRTGQHLLKSKNLVVEELPRRTYTNHL